MRSPIFGPAYVTKSTNFADNRLINLYPEGAQEPGAKDAGALYVTDGLALEVYCGNGPVRGMRLFGTTLYIVSGSGVYTLQAGGSPQLVGTITTSTGPVSFIVGSGQIAILDGTTMWLAPVGYPLTGGTIGNGGTGNAVGDILTLKASSGTQVGTATVTVGAVSSGVVTSFSVTATGSFATEPASLTQTSTTGNGTGFVLDSPTFGTTLQLYKVPLPFTNPTMGAYQDGFGLALQGGTNAVWQSNALDLSVWQGLAFSTADGNPEPIQAILELHREIWLIKQTTSEVWDDVGTFPFAFARNSGVYPEVGCAAPFSVAQMGEFAVFLAQTKMGDRRVCMMEGYRPTFISNAWIENAIASYAVVDDAIGYAYEKDGHIFYVLTFPTGNTTWVYDLTESMRAQMPVWHQRAAFLNGQFNRHWGNCYAFFDESHLIGDYLTGNIYAFSNGQSLDNGQQRKWLRSWRALPKPTDKPVSFHSLRIDMETGIGVASGANPQVVLRWSDDGGWTWTPERYAEAGQIGQTARRVMFRRLGSTRRNSGLDRVFELSSTDSAATAIIGAVLE